MASIFNLDILNDKDYNKFNIVVNKTLHNKGVRNVKKQFASKKDLELFLNSIQTIFGHSLYVKNQIFRYCKNPRYKAQFEQYQKTIMMLSFADIKFNKKYNLSKNLNDFHKLFNSIQSSEKQNSKQKKSQIHEDYETLIKITESLKRSNKFTNKIFQNTINPMLDKPFLSKLNIAIENIVKNYSKIREELIQSEHDNEYLRKSDYFSLMESSDKNNAVLYYGFVITYKSIMELYYIIKNDLIEKLIQTGLFN